MNKRLISLLLVVMMLFTLLPMAALAEESDVGTVKVVVFGKAISDALYKENDLSKLPEMIKKNIQDALAGEHMPECNIVLVAEDGTEYPLERGNGEFIESLDIEYHSAFSSQEGEIAEKYKELLSTLSDFIDSVKSTVSESFVNADLTDKMKDFYVTYSSDQIPVGDYTLRVKEIKGNGYKLWEPANGSVPNVSVKKDKVTVAGFAKEYSPAGVIEKAPVLKAGWNGINNLVNVINKLISLIPFGHIEPLEVPTITTSVTGIWLKREDPGFKFIKTDLADKPLPGAEFLMVDRNETIKIVKAMATLGKETFTNAMKLVGTEGFTWEELSILNAGLISRDEETNQIGLDPVAAKKLVDTYWALVEASASEPFASFLDEDLKVPALLKATSDDEGIVHFTEDSNITLVWTIDVLMKMANFSDDMIQTAEVPEGTFENENLEAIAETFLKVAKAFSKDGTNVLQEGGERLKTFINDWVYPILQNEDIPAKFSQIMKILDPNSASEALSWSKFIPNHAILTSKMPASDYILMEEKAPEGYMRNPIFYTIHLTWDTEQEDVSKWCYVTVADIGIIGPYLAENYYTFFRNNSFVSVSDKILNRVMGKDVNVLEWVLANEEGATAATLDYWAKLISANMAGDSENGSEEAVANELAQYVIKHGDNVQSLMHFAYTVANRRRAVISSEVNEEWHFYNFNDSIHTSYATRITALLEGAKASIKNDTLVGQATKAVIQAQIDTVAAVDKTITSVTARYTAAVKEAVGKVADSVKSSVTEAAKSVVSSLLKRLFK